MTFQQQKISNTRQATTFWPYDIFAVIALLSHKLSLAPSYDNPSLPLIIYTVENSTIASRFEHNNQDNFLEIRTSADSFQQ